MKFKTLCNILLTSKSKLMFKILSKDLKNKNNFDKYFLKKLKK